MVHGVILAPHAERSSAESAFSVLKWSIDPVYCAVDNCVVCVRFGAFLYVIAMYMWAES